MRDILIFDGQVAGEGLPSGDLPVGWTAQQTDLTCSLGDLYLLDGTIAEKPPRPSETAYWAGSEWREPAPFSYSPPYNLFETDYWVKAAVDTAPTVKKAYHLLIALGHQLHGDLEALKNHIEPDDYPDSRD